MSASVQRRALEEELRLVLEQKATIEAQLAALRSSGRPAALKALKRNSSVMPAKTHVPATKKQKVEDRQKRLQSLWGQMNTLLKQICKQRDAAHFQAPVDAEKLKVPDYYKIIKKPMDLGTVKNKLEDKPERGQPRAYKDPYELLADVRQVWANCRAYNPEGHPVRQMGDRLSDAWEKKWHASGIEGKWEDIMREQKADELGPAIVPHRCKEMGAELRELTQLAAPAPGSEPSGPRDFTFEDKRRLSQQLGSLPGERLLRVLEIVAKSSVPPVNEEGEAEVDIDALDNATLLELEEYVNGVLDDLARKTDSMKAATAKQPQPARTQPDQETSSRPLDGASPAGGNSAAPAPGAIAEKSPAGAAPGNAGQRGSASRSSASSDSSKSSDGSMGEVGSKHESGDGGFAKRAETAADQSTLVSATHPQQAPPIYQPKSRKDVTLQNEGAWGALAAAQPSAAKDVAKPADGSAGAAGSGPNSSAPGEQDPLWSEFASREQQQRKREAEKAAEEEKRRAEKAKAEEAVRKQAEERRKAAEAEAEAERAKVAESRAKADAELEEQRQREMQALQTDAMDLAGPQDTGRFEGGGGNALAALGLVSKPEDDDDDDSDEEADGQDEDMEDAEKEEGEA